MRRMNPLLPLQKADRRKPGGARVLGIGGELKNTFCLAKGSLYYPSAYVGDLTDIRTVDALKGDGRADGAVASDSA